MKTLQILIKQALTLVFILMLAGKVEAQKSSNPKITLANQHIVFINQLTDKLIQSQKCLYQLYWALESNRKSKQTYFIGSGYTCSAFIDENQLTTLLELSTKTGDSNAAEINSQTQSIYNIYLKINQLCRELEIYVRLKDYSKDRLKQSDDIFNKLALAYNEYNFQKASYYQYLVDLTEPALKNQTASNLSCYMQMQQYLNGEQKLISLFKINFFSQTFTASLPIDELLGQIKDSDKYLADLKIPENKELALFKQFVADAKSQIQYPKRDVVDNYSLDARKSDDYANSFIRIHIDYFNEYLVHDFNEFAKTRTIPLLFYPKMVAGFKVDSLEQAYKPQIIRYKANEIPSLKMSTTNAKIETKTVRSLNNYIEFINEELRINYDFATKLYYLNGLANKQLESKNPDLYLSFSFYDKYALPTAAYEKAIAESQYIDKKYSPTLNQLFTELFDIINEKYQLIVDLDSYVNKKAYKTDKHAHLYELLERFEYLLEMFDQRKELLYQYSRQIKESYAVTEFGPWTIGGSEMLKQLDANHVALDQVKEQLINEKYASIGTSTINELSRNLLLKEYDNLKGLTKIGRNNGNCPYNPYEDIATGSSQFAEMFAKYPNNEYIKKDVSKYYRDFVYRYNDLADDYNKFVDLASGGYETFDTHKTKPVFMLKNVKQAVFYKFSKLQINETGAVEEPIKDKPKISMEGYAANNLVLLLDVSGSMKTVDKLPLLRESFLKILPYLRGEDEISIVIFSGKGNVLLNAVSCSEKEKIAGVLNSLESKGQSNFDNGLKLAYKTAKSNFKTKANNRIVIATDGAFAIDDDLYRMAEQESEKKVFLSVFSFGSKDNKVRSLDKLAGSGKGNYEYIQATNAVDKLLKELQVLEEK